MITEQQAAGIAASAARLRKALHDAGFPDKAWDITGHAMPALVQVVCAVPELAPGDESEDGGLVPATPEIPVTQAGRGFSVSLDALRGALESGAGSVTFTAPPGWHFGSDRRLHPGETLADAGELPETGPCAATQAYGATGCT